MGAMPQTASTWSESPLTRREREVAGLVARGMTNREIAETLTISQRTAESHLDHILGKLAMANRVQLAAWVVSHDSKFRISTDVSWNRPD